MNQNKSESIPAEDMVDLRHYWRILMRFKVGIVAMGIIAAIIASLVVLAQDDIYESEATLLIEGNQAQITSVEQLYGIDTQNQEYYATQHEMLKNRTLAERVIGELNLISHPEFLPDDKSATAKLIGSIRSSAERLAADYLPRLIPLLSAETNGTSVRAANAEQILLTEVLNVFNDRLTIEPVRNTQLANIRFEANDPQLAADVANRLANAYIEDNLEQRLSATQTANSWLSGSLERLRLTLEESEHRLQEFLEQEQLISMGDVTSLNVQELDELTTQSIEARRRSAEAEATYRQIERLAEPDVNQLMTIPAILNHISIQGIRDQVDEVNGEIAQLSQRYGRNHPRMISLASQRSAAEADLARQVNQVYASIENEYLTAQQNERSTMARLDQSKIALQGISRNNFALHELEREVETNRQLYDMFFTRIRETDETDSFQNTNAVVVDPAVPGIYPSKPRRSMIVAIAALAGLLFGVMLALLRDMLDNTVKTPADIEERLQTEVLGVVPLEKQSGSKKKRALAFMGFRDAKHASFTEALRTVRTGITLSSLDEPHKVLAVTSTLTNEGKTTVAVNLAVAMGQVGKTLLIDADMRKPSVSKSIGLEPDLPGLSNLVIDGFEHRESCIHWWEEGQLDVLPAGQFVSNPLEVVSSAKFKKVLEQLREIYDTIIVDTPPVNAVSDALIIASRVDAVTYVVKAGSTPVNAIKSGMHRLNNARDNLLGVVLNQVDSKKQSYYGEGDYYGGYLDTYGYGAARTATSS